MYVSNKREVKQMTRDEEINEILNKIYADIQNLRGCSCGCSDGIVDEIEDILDKYKK